MSIMVRATISIMLIATNSICSIRGLKKGMTFLYEYKRPVNKTIEKALIRFLWEKGVMEKSYNGFFRRLIEKMDLAGIKNKVHILIYLRVGVSGDSGDYHMFTCIHMYVHL